MQNLSVDDISSGWVPASESRSNVMLRSMLLSISWLSRSYLLLRTVKLLSRLSGDQKNFSLSPCDVLSTQQKVTLTYFTVLYVGPSTVDSCGAQLPGGQTVCSSLAVFRNASEAVSPWQPRSRCRPAEPRNAHRLHSAVEVSRQSKSKLTNTP